MGTGGGDESSLLNDLTGLQGSRSVSSFLEIAFDAVIVFDTEEKITSWNPAAEKIFGWTAQEAQGKTAAELFWPADVPLNNENKEQRQARLKRGETLRGELLPCRKDGSSFPAQFAACAILDADGKANGYLAVYRDLSDRRLASEKADQLQQSNQRLNQILASIQDDFYVLNRDWVFVFASRTFTSRIGKEPGDFIGNNIWEMFPNHVGGTLYENFHTAMEKRQIRRFEIPGRYTNAWYRMNVFPSEEGITVIGTDITEVKKAEEALLRSKKTFQELIERAPFGVYVVDSQFRIAHMNVSSQAGAFRNIQPVIGRDLGEAMHILWPEETASGIISAFRHTLETGEPYYSPRFTNPRQDVAAVESYEWELQRMVLPDGQYGVICYYYDSTRLREAEAAVRESDERYRIVGEVIPFGVWETDREGNATYLSPLYLALTGKTLEEHRQSWQTLIHAEETDSLVKAWRECVQSGALWDREFQVRGRDGNYYAIHARGMPVYNPAGEITSYVGINFDVTSHRRTEEALRESERQLQILNASLEVQVLEKTAEVRSLAADLVLAVQSERHRISHILHDDLQQRIYAIQMQLTFLRNELSRVNQAAHNEALDLGKQLEEVLQITRHLSIDLSPPILPDEGLTQAIGWLANQMRQRYGLPVEIQADGSFTIPNEELQVLLFNCVRELLFNVVKHAQATRTVVTLQWMEDILRIEVIDDGKGFPEQTADQLSGVETSEEEDWQLTFGLPTLRHQLSLFDGQMEIRSQPGEGTQVILTIPLAKNQ